MTVSQPQLIPLRRLRLLPNNPRTITQEQLNRLCDSIRQNGYWPHRPMAVEPIEGTDEYYVLDGNQRKKALGRLKRKEALCVIYTDLTEDERNDIILRSNINNGDWEQTILQTDFAPVVDLEAIGLDIQFEVPDLAAPTDLQSVGNESKDLQSDKEGITNADTQGDGITNPAEREEPDDEQGDGAGEDRMAFWYKMMGDYLYPSDNEFDIPTLLLDNQPVHLELPFAPWGAEARYKKGIATYHFYVDDYRFEQLYKDPIRLLQSGCRAVVEPNNSIHDQTPTAYALYQIYRKRYLARYLQECGLQVWVDLNVAPRHEELNALGIPQGYNAFFTRGVSGWQATLDRHLQMARRISGLEHPNLVVYGGGRDIEQWCRENGVTWSVEYMNRRRSEGKAK